MQRAGVRSVGSCRQTRYARINPGVEDQVAEDRQEALQGVDSCEISQFAGFRKSQKTTNTHIFNKSRVAPRVHYLRAKESSNLRMVEAFDPPGTESWRNIMG